MAQPLELLESLVLNSKSPFGEARNRLRPLHKHLKLAQTTGPSGMNV